MGRICGETMPTMLLSSLSECVCFLLGRLDADLFLESGRNGPAIGALSTMPAVRTFSLYAGLAILFDFALQVTCFAALFTVDVRREEARRLELAYCVRLAPPPQGADSRENEGLLFAVVRDFYTPFLLHTYVKVVVVRRFQGLNVTADSPTLPHSCFCSPAGCVPRWPSLTSWTWVWTKRWHCPRFFLRILREDIAIIAICLLQDSYVQQYFRAMTRLLSVGPPVYFVVKGKLDYSNVTQQNLVCATSGCRLESLASQVYTASVWPNK